MHYRCIYTALTLSLMALPSACLSEQLRLINGDILNGKLLEKSATHLIWMSDNFGRLTIQLSQIINLDKPSDSGDFSPHTDPNPGSAPRYSGGLSITRAAAIGMSTRPSSDAPLKHAKRCNSNMKIIAWRNNGPRTGTTSVMPMIGFIVTSGSGVMRRLWGPMKRELSRKHTR